jgi:hypothetical protein
MKKIVRTFLLAMLCLGLIAGCSKNSDASGETVIRTGAAPLLSERYNSIKELKTEAFDMVEVDVKSNESVLYHELGFTISTVEIISSLNGNFEQGQQIRIVQTGGRYEYTGKNPKIPKGQVIETTMMGIPVMAPSEKYFLFIKKYEGEVTNDAYRILGLFQGKFKIKDNDVIQNAPEEYKIKDYTKETIDKFKKIVKEIQ